MAADQERADRIRALKQERPDLTWRRIADHVGVSERAATAWQRQGGIEYANAVKLAELFEVDPNYLFRGTPDDERAPTPFRRRERDLENGDLADQIDRIEQALADAKQQRAEHDAAIRALLQRQDAVLQRIEQAIRREEAAKNQAEAATQDLLAAVDAANRALVTGPQRSAARHAPRAK